MFFTRGAVARSPRCFYDAVVCIDAAAVAHNGIKLCDKAAEARGTDDMEAILQSAAMAGRFTAIVEHSFLRVSQMFHQPIAYIYIYMYKTFCISFGKAIRRKMEKPTAVFRTSRCGLYKAKHASSGAQGISPHRRWLLRIRLVFPPGV
jgi:hypothetical protein